MKRLILLFFFIASILSAQVIKEAWRLDNTTATNLSPIKQWDILPFGNQLGNLGATGTRWNFLYADTTITNHLSNTTWTLNSVGVTTTGTQINYLNGATGTTGTTTTNLVFSTSPVLVTPTLGVASGTSLALGGATLGSNVFSARGTWQFGTGTGSSATDSSIVWSSNSGSPLQTFYGTDGDAFSIGINTSDEALFTGASGGYSFDGYNKIVGQLDVWQGSGVSLLLGADNSATTRTNATPKIGRIAVPHYTNSEEPVTIFHSNIQSGNNEINFGGGSSLMNAANYLRFMTGAASTTLIGTIRIEIDNNGKTAFYTGSGSSTTDSSLIFDSNSGSPRLSWYGTDGDAFSIGINTSDEALFTGASGGYSFDGAITSTSNTSTWDSLTVRKEASTLADSLGVITLATGVAGWGEVMAGDNQEWAHFRFTSAGVVTLINNSANVGTTENDVDKLNIYDAGAGVVIQNNLGASIKVAININYFVP